VRPCKLSVSLTYSVDPPPRGWTRCQRPRPLDSNHCTPSVKHNTNRAD